MLLADKQADAVANSSRGPMEVRGRESVEHDARRNHATAAVVAESTTAVHVAGHRLLLVADKQAGVVAYSPRRPEEARGR